MHIPDAKDNSIYVWHSCRTCGRTTPVVRMSQGHSASRILSDNYCRILELLVRQIFDAAILQRGNASNLPSSCTRLCASLYAPQQSISP